MIGARARRTRRPPAARRVGNALLNGLASYLTGRPIPDLTSGSAARAREYLREFLHLLPNGFSTPTTTTLAFIKAGYNVAFEPVDARQRSGNSKIRFARDGARFLLILLKIVTLFSPLRIFLPISVVVVRAGIALRRLEHDRDRQDPERRGDPDPVCASSSSSSASSRSRSPRCGSKAADMSAHAAAGHRSRPTTSATTCPLWSRRCCAIAGLRVLVVDDASPDGTGADSRCDSRRRSAARVAGAAPHRPARASAARTSTACMRRCDTERRTSARWTPTSRTIRRTAAAAARGGDGSADLVIGSRYVPGGALAQLAAAPRAAERVRELLHPRHHRPAGRATAPAASAAGAARRSRGCRSTRFVSDGYAFQVEMPWEALARRRPHRRSADHVRRAA